MNKILLSLILALLFIVTAQGQVIKDDFLINDDTTGTNHHMYCDVNTDSIGNFVIAFTESRIPGVGGNPGGIYAQRYDNLGNLIGGNFAVSDTFVSDAEMNFPSVGMAPNGRFVISWAIGTALGAKIYARVYDSAGIPVGSSICVSETQSTRRENDVAMDDNGNFVVVWTLFGQNGGDCYARRFDSNGNSLGPPILVKAVTSPIGAGPRNPRIAIDKNGNFVVCWEDHHTNENWDIWAQRYDSAGSPIGTNFMLNSDSTSGNQISSNIGVEPDGKFAATWYAWAGSPSRPRVYVRLFNVDGSPVTGTSVVNELPANENARDSDIAMNKMGFVVTWHRYAVPSINDIFVQQYDSLGNKVGANIKVNDSNEYYRVDSRIAKSMTGQFVVAWVDGRGGDGIYKIYGQRYSSDGNPQGSNFKVTEQGIANQELPIVAMDRTGKGVVVWVDYRLGPSAIAGQRIDALGNLVGANFRVDDNGMLPKEASVAIGGNDNFVAVWTHFTAGEQDIWGQLFNWYTGMIGPMFLVNTNDLLGPPPIQQAVPAVAMSKSGKYAITWHSQWGGLTVGVPRGINCRLYQANGDTLGPIFLVYGSDDWTDSLSYHPSIAMDSSGNFAVVWQDRRDANWNIYCRLYDSLGTPSGPDFKVNDDIGIQPQVRPWVAMNHSGSFVIAWQDYRNGEWDIYGQRYSPSGSPIDANFMVTDASAITIGDSSFYAPSGYVPPIGLSIDDTGRFIICWSDKREGAWDIYAQAYNADGSPNGGNYRVNNNIEGTNPDQWAPSVSINGNGVVFAWTDAKRDKGWDIYAKLFTWPLVGTEETAFRSTPNALRLLVYPNPAHNSIAFSFNLSEPAQVKIEIYNVIGQKIKLLTNAIYNPGEYSLNWNFLDEYNRELPQGAYFYRMTTGNDSKTGKVVLLK